MKIEQKAFEIFIAIENLFGINRNFTTFNVFRKIIAFVSVFIYSSMCLYVCAKVKDFTHLYMFLSSIFSMICFLSSCYYSKHYVKFLYSLNANDLLVDLKNDKIYSDRLASNFRIGLIRLCTYTAIVVIQLTFADVYNTHIMTSVQDFHDIFLVANRSINNFRLHIEFEFLTYTYYALSEQLQCITRSVTKKSFYCRKNDPNLSIYLEKWRQNYVNVINSTELLNDVYGLQLTISFCVITVRYTRIFYATVAYGLKDSNNIFRSVPLFVLVLCSVIMLVTTARAAQQLQSGAGALTRSLKMFLMRTQADELEQRLVKQMLHIVSTRPIRLRAYGGIDVNMRLIPACLAIVVSYTIVALQFNNVV